MIPIPGTENAVNPFFSPDGNWLGFGADPAGSRETAGRVVGHLPPGSAEAAQFWHQIDARKTRSVPLEVAVSWLGVYQGRSQ